MAKKVSDLPYNSLAEKAVLGSALLSKDACLDVTTSLVESDFYIGKHQLIFRAIMSLNQRNVPVDVLTLTEELINMKELDNIGGVEYLKECSDSMVALSSLQFYIKIVYDQSVLRSMLNAVRDINTNYLTTELDDVNDFILKSEELFKRAIERRRVSSFLPMKDIAPVVEQNIANRQAREDNLVGLTSGFKEINALTQGFKKGEITILAARPSVGKTALGLNFAFKVATQGHVSVAVFSAEMDKDTLFQRLVASESMVSLTKINSGTLTREDRTKVASGIRSVAASNLYIDDTPSIKLTDLMNKAKKLQISDPNLGFIVIDYLGLIQANTGNKNDSRQEAVRLISLSLKQLARELNIPVLCLCQLNRNTEQRGGNNRPQLSDLRESGSIEQDADVVMLLFREDYYDKKDKASSSNKKPSQLSNAERFEIAKEQKEKAGLDDTMGSASYIEVIVAKNRNGQTGKCGLFFYKEYQKFSDPPPEWKAAMREIGEDNK